MSLTSILVKLQIAIAAEISTLVTLLENANADVLVVVSDILAQLADHGECLMFTIGSPILNPDL